MGWGAGKERMTSIRDTACPKLMVWNQIDCVETKHTGGLHIRTLLVTDSFNDNEWPLSCPTGQMGWSRRGGRQVSLTVPNMISCALQGRWQDPRERESRVDQHSSSSCAMQSLRASWGPLVKALWPSQNFSLGLVPYSLFKCFKINKLQESTENSVK